MAIEGYVDHCKGDLIGGWAWDKGQPEKRLAVEINVNGKRVARVVARQYRDDLKKAGIGDGAHGFEYSPVSPIDPRSQEISVVVAEANVCLSQSKPPIPVPPSEMIFLVVGHRDTQGFLASGAACLDYIENALKSVDFNPKGKRRILDWGCGCGRIARHWAPLASEIELFGCDIYEPAIRWCRDNIPFGDFTVCGMAPPLPYPDGYFDVIYGASVLTHLTFEMHYSWMREIWRLLTPVGLAVLTISGPSLLPLMLQRIGQGNDADKSAIRVVLIDEEVFMCIERQEGSNDTANVETHGAFARLFYPFNIKHFRPRYGLMGIHDTYVLGKKSEAKLEVRESLLECEMGGTKFRADIPLELKGHRHFCVLASARNLFHPATLRLTIRPSGSDNLVAESPLVDLPEKVAWTCLQDAYTVVTVENIPEWNGTAVVSIEVHGTKPLEQSRLHLHNAMLF